MLCHLMLHKVGWLMGSSGKQPILTTIYFYYCLSKLLKCYGCEGSIRIMCQPTTDICGFSYWTCVTVHMYVVGASVSCAVWSVCEMKCLKHSSNFMQLIVSGYVVIRFLFLFSNECLSYFVIDCMNLELQYSSSFFSYVTKLRKVTVRFVMSVHMEHGSHWVEFYEIWYLRIFRSCIKKI
jgi:hypothetical protein